MALCFCPKSCKTHKGDCKRVCMAGSTLCDECRCTCSGHCGHSDCAPRCQTARKGGCKGMCQKCASGAGKLQARFPDEGFSCESMQSLLCHPLVVSLLSPELKDSIGPFRLAHVGRLGCPRCSADLRGVARKPPHDQTGACLLNVSQADGDNLAALLDKLRSFGIKARKVHSRGAGGGNEEPDDTPLARLDADDIIVPLPSALVEPHFSASADADVAVSPPSLVSLLYAASLCTVACHHGGKSIAWTTGWDP